MERRGGGVATLIHTASLQLLRYDVSSPWFVACEVQQRCSGRRVYVLNAYLPPVGSVVMRELRERGVGEAAVVAEVLGGVRRLRDWAASAAVPARLLAAGDWNARVGGGMCAGVRDGVVDGRGRALLHGMRQAGMEGLNGRAGWGTGGPTTRWGSTLDVAFGRGLGGPGAARGVVALC